MYLSRGKFDTAEGEIRSRDRGDQDDEFVEEGRFD